VESNNNLLISGGMVGIWKRLREEKAKKDFSEKGNTIVCLKYRSNNLFEKRVLTGGKGGDAKARNDLSGSVYTSREHCPHVKRWGGRKRSTRENKVRSITSTPIEKKESWIKK